MELVYNERKAHRLQINLPLDLPQIHSLGTIILKQLVKKYNCYLISNYLSAEPSPCHKHLMRVLGNTGIVPPGYHIPNCRSDGSYNPVQCEGSTPYCWCVNENGHEIPGTKELGQPKCKDISKSSYAIHD